MTTVQEKQEMFRSLDYTQKKNHLLKMLAPANGKIDFLTVIYEYVEGSDATVAEDVFVVLYDSVSSLMESFASMGEVEKKGKVQDMLAYIREQSKKDQEDSEDILSQL